MPIVQVKLYDKRVTEESVPKIIEAMRPDRHVWGQARLRLCADSVNGVPRQVQVLPACRSRSRASLVMGPGPGRGRYGRSLRLPRFVLAACTVAAAGRPSTSYSSVCC